VADISVKNRDFLLIVMIVVAAVTTVFVGLSA
jgi:hypothetical protein